MRDSEEDNRTIYCGNLSEEVTDALLYELFNQAGPVESLRRPKDPSGRPKPFAFIIYKHDCSVPYALQLLRGDKLFNRQLNINSRSTLHHIPVLDTHLTEFNEPRIPWNNDPRCSSETESRSYRGNEYHGYRETEPRNHYNEDRNRREGNCRRDGHHGHHHSFKEDRKQNEPTSWAEVNALRGKDSFLNGYQRNDLQGPSERKRVPGSNMCNNPHPISPGMPDFNALLQMGQQMMIPGMMSFSGMMPTIGMLPVGLAPVLGGNMFPSMQGKMGGGDRNSPDRDRGRRDHYDRRGDRRDHPYNDYRHSDNRDDHRRHDRGYSSSRSTHDRERRDRRSR